MAHYQSVSLMIRFLLGHLILLSLVRLSRADPPYQLCSKHLSDSTFQNNLGNLTANLSSNALLSHFYSTSYGDGTDRVYGQHMCLNYVRNQECQNCVVSASQDILRLCTNDAEAIVWEEHCQLRYSGRDFIGHLDITGNIWKDNLMNVSRPDRFNLAVNATLQNLTRVAAFDPLSDRYATGAVKVKDASASRLYALVQCGRDLSGSDCNICLQQAIADVLGNCSFSVGARILSRSCYLRYEQYAFYEGETAPEPNQTTQGGSRKKIWLIVILTVIAAGLAVLLLVSCVYYRQIHKRERRVTQLGVIQNTSYASDSTSFMNQTFQRRFEKNASDSPFIDFATILTATNYFSASNKLGQGGFGPVYKGILGDGREVAIKRLSSTEQGTDEFTNEVLLIMKLQHKNLVKLLGFCVDNEEKILVYEYMLNGSLDVVLFDRERRAKLDWRKRINIISGIARGVLYLHEDSRLRIIHRDLKASNILLDSEMNPKISDFGMARIFSGNDGRANTATIVGTYGYMAPEYAMEGLYSTKSDVFSFGVLVLEIITGERNASFHLTRRAPTLAAYAWHLWQDERELELVDPLIIDSCCAEEFRRYMQIGLLCVQEDAYDRPTMSSAVVMMQSESTTLTNPQRPAFSVGRFAEYHQEVTDNGSSVNGLTISNVDAR
ncbi:cysteine-rich receptor-like protein kinase 10 isoform X2 [Rhodamnia argentea]|uniref:Cysteine-rich receptor-like protein kinase 10 isoform X2 n=1 Tax=Rhodamnia argentea TaxID=178133 RepID=A0ABM3H8J2_9MYRT|nr:cysteine-rich receptor-like protein kinase 10 isoform X2 [Rhodamnia argentea]